AVGDRLAGLQGAAGKRPATLLRRPSAMDEQHPLAVKRHARNADDRPVGIASAQLQENPSPDCNTRGGYGQSCYAEPARVMWTSTRRTLLLGPLPAAVWAKKKKKKGD